MKLLAITNLMTIALGCCHGRSDSNCSVPTFINSSQCSTEHNCYWYSLPTISYGDRVTMRVDVLDDNLTLIWTVTINGHTEVIDKYNGQYIREDHNKTLVWPSAAAGSTMFKVTATNSCGGQATACFTVNDCISCTILPSFSPNQRKKLLLFENSNHTFQSSVEGDDGFSKLQWCFVGANNFSVCCMCDGKCSESDWKLMESKNKCDSCKYSCSLTVYSMAMKYNNGTFYSYVLYSGINKNLDNISITMISSDNSQSHKSCSIYFIIGSAAGFVVFIFIAIGFVYVIKKRECCRIRRSLEIMYPVDHTSPTPVEARSSRETSPILEPTTGDFNPYSRSNYGSTDREQHVVLFN